MSEALARLGATVVGIDATGDAIETAKAHIQKEKNQILVGRLTYQNTTVEEYLVSVELSSQRCLDLKFDCFLPTLTKIYEKGRFVNCFPNFRPATVVKNLTRLLPPRLSSTSKTHPYLFRHAQTLLCLEDHFSSQPSTGLRGREWNRSIG